MTTQPSDSGPPHGEALCEAILKYHWASHDDNRKSEVLYERAVKLSDTFWAANRDLLETQDRVFLSYSHDHTSVYVFLDDHDEEYRMVKWGVCKPLGSSGAMPRSHRQGSPKTAIAESPSGGAHLAWGPEFYEAAIASFWGSDDEDARNHLHERAVAYSDSFWDANPDLLETQEWVILTKGPHDLALLVFLGDWSKEEKYLSWSPCRLEAWYGALPREKRREGMPWVHRIAYNDLSH